MLNQSKDLYQVRSDFSYQYVLYPVSWTVGSGGWFCCGSWRTIPVFHGLQFFSTLQLPKFVFSTSFHILLKNYKISYISSKEYQTHVSSLTTCHLSDSRNRACVEILWTRRNHGRGKMAAVEGAEDGHPTVPR